MSDDELLRYFMKETNKSLAEIKSDVKSLLAFRMMLLGGAAIVSAVTSYAVIIMFGR